MPAPNIYPPETILGARQNYMDGLSAREITAKWRVSTRTLYKWIRGEVAGMTLSPLPLRRPGVRRMQRAARHAVVRCVWDSAQRQAREIDARLATAQTPAERQADARLLSLLVRTLRDLRALDRREDDSPRSGAATPESEEADVRDVEEFRRELARKMDAVVAARKAGGDDRLHDP